MWIEQEAYDREGLRQAHNLLRVKLRERKRMDFCTVKRQQEASLRRRRRLMPEVLPEGCSPEKPLAKKMVRVTSPKKLSQFESSG